MASRIARDLRLSSASQAKSVDELVEYRGSAHSLDAKGSVGSLYHVLTRHMARQFGPKVVHVSCRGAAPMLQDIAGRQADFANLPYPRSCDGLAAQRQPRQRAGLAEERSA